MGYQVYMENEYTFILFQAGRQLGIFETLEAAMLHAEEIAND